MALCVALLLPACSPQPDARAGSALVEEQFAHHVGVIAYLFGYPMVDMFRRMHNETHHVAGEQAFYAPLNTLAPVGEESWAGWLDLRRGSVDLRLTAPAGSRFELVNTNFYGERSRVRWVIDASGSAELSLHSALAPRDGASLDIGTPVAHLAVLADHALPQGAASLQGGQSAPAEVRVAGLDPMRSLGFFEVLNTLLKDLPTRPGDARLLEQFDGIGVGPRSNFSLADLSPSRKRGLERAIRDARTMLEAAVASRAQWSGDRLDLLGRAASYAAAVEQGLSAERSTGADSR